MKHLLPSALLFLVVLPMTACRETGSQIQGNIAVAPATPPQQVLRKVPFKAIRHVMIRGPKQPSINPNYDINAAYYLCGKCNPGTDTQPGKMGLSTGAVVQTARYGKTGPNWVEFPFEADGAYIETSYPATVDKSISSPVSSYYRLVFDDDTHARILSSYTDSLGNSRLSDYGYRMTFDANTGEWHRFSTPSRDVNISTPDYQYTPQAPSQYRLFEIYTGDNDETKFTQQFIDDQKTSAVQEFAVKVAETDPLARDDLPTGPFRDADRMASTLGVPDSASDKNSSSADDSSADRGSAGKNGSKAGAR